MVMCEFEKAYFFQAEHGGKFVNRDFLFHVFGCNIVDQRPHCDEYCFGQVASIFAPDSETAADMFFEEYGVYSRCLVVPLYMGEFFDNDEFMEVMSNGNY